MHLPVAGSGFAQVPVPVPLTRTVAKSESDTLVFPASPVAVTVLVESAKHGTGVFPPEPVFGGELWTIGIVTVPKPEAPKAFLLTVRVYPFT